MTAYDLECLGCGTSDQVEPAEPTDTWLPPGWREIRFGEIVEFTKKPRGLRYSDYEQVPFVPMEMVPDNDTSIRGFEYRSGAEVGSGTYFERGDVLVAKITPSFENGKQAIVRDMPTPFGIATTEVIPFRERPGVSDKLFLFYVLLQRDIRSGLADKMEGSTGRQRLAKSALANLTVLVPPLEEQRVIADVLDSIRQTIQTRLREAELERERKNIVLDTLISFGVGGPDKPQPVPTRYGPVRPDWLIQSLSSCASIQTGVAKGKKVREEEALQVPYLRVANVQDGFLDLTEIKSITLREAEVARYLLRESDVLVTEGGDIDKLGRGFIWRGEVPGCVHQNHVFAVRSDREKVEPEYLTYLFQSRYGKAYFLSVGHRTTNLASINSTKLSNFPVPTPPLDEQRQMVEVIQASDATLAALAREIALLEELFQTALDGFMSGRVSVLTPILSLAEA